jgi:hypothetical protein
LLERIAVLPTAMMVEPRAGTAYNDERFFREKRSSRSPTQNDGARELVAPAINLERFDGAVNRAVVARAHQMPTLNAPSSSW